MALKGANFIEFCIELVIGLYIMASMLPAAVSKWVAENASLTSAGASAVALWTVVPIVVIGLAIYRVYKAAQ